MTDKEYLEETINSMRQKDLYYREAAQQVELADKYKHEADRLQRILAVYGSALRWSTAKHTGDANCNAGDCDDCTKPPASIELQLICEIVLQKEALACGNG